ncbi:MAG TPA: hypothetical protein VKT27_14520 [Candidatus Binataceae bacterium]|nr:hypothetical protein [Candidatus Binataceae bacterium]
MQRNRPTIVISAMAALSILIAGGCFSYHSNTREYRSPTAQIPPSEPPGATTTTTTTTQSDDGAVHQHSTTTYNP